MPASIDRHWNKEPRVATPVRLYRHAKPVYALPLAPCDVDDIERFAFLNNARRWGDGEWMRLAEIGDDVMVIDRAFTPPGDLEPFRQGATLYLELEWCRADDPKRLGTYRRSNWKLV